MSSSQTDKSIVFCPDIAVCIGLYIVQVDFHLYHGLGEYSILIGWRVGVG